MSKKFREPCGCVSTDSRWIELCPPHRAEEDELHARAAADHKRQALEKIVGHPIEAVGVALVDGEELK